jgi:D-alanyl-D-alanine carboxypeptidase
MSTRHLAIPAIVAATAAFAPAATAHTADQAAVRQAADAVRAAGAPGVLVEYRDASGGSFVVRRGVADLKRRRPVQRAASFRIGSVTKTYLATAVLQAAGEGQLSLDDTLERWLPGVVPALQEDKITVRMLLDHTSGVPDPSPRLLQHPALFGDGPVTPADLVAKARKLPPVAPPGRTFAYSNADYWLLAMILRRATGHSYRHAIAEGILRPLRARHTMLPRHTTRLPRPFLHGYSGRDDVTAFYADWGSSSGGMISTVGDLNRFTRALLSGRLLRPAELDAMKHGVAVPPNPMGVTRYGLGLVTTRLRCGTVLYGNTGGLAGYTTWMLSTADGTRRIAVASNTDETPRIDRAIRRVVAAAFCR